MDIGKNIGDFFTGIIYLLSFFFIISIVLGVMFLIQLFRGETIKSKTPIKPQIELVTDGKKVDTIYIYKLPWYGNS